MQTYVVEYPQHKLLCRNKNYSCDYPQLSEAMLHTVLSVSVKVYSSRQSIGETPLISTYNISLCGKNLHHNLCNTIAGIKAKTMLAK